MSEAGSDEWVLVNNWVFVKARDSPGNDITRVENLDEENLKAEAERLGALAFNTQGWIKHSVAPTTSWSAWDDEQHGMYIKAEVFEDAKERGLAIASQKALTQGKTWSYGPYMITHYWADIPADYRLLSTQEYADNAEVAVNCLKARDPGGWTIAMCSDGKCDGHGYSPPNGGTHLMAMSEVLQHNKYTMGDVMLVQDSSVSSNWVEAIGAKLASAPDHIQHFVSYSKDVYNDKAGVMVFSCPSDVHNGGHTRVKAFTEAQGWDFAPVQFEPWTREALEWVKFWKINVETCLTHIVERNQHMLLEVQISGGGANSEIERSLNMTHWWVDCVKRMGTYLYTQLSNNPSAKVDGVDLGPDTRAMMVCKVVLNEDDYKSFPTEGGRLKPITTTEGVDLEVHTIILQGAPSPRYWMVNSVNYRLTPKGEWESTSSSRKAGTY